MKPGRYRGCDFFVDENGRPQKKIDTRLFWWQEFD